MNELINYDDPWTLMMDKMLNSQKGGGGELKYLDPMTIVVRVLDGQREGHLKEIFDFTRFDFAYMPREVKNQNYFYTPAQHRRLQ